MDCYLAAQQPASANSGSPRFCFCIPTKVCVGVTGPLRPDHGPFSGWYDAAGWFRKRCQRSLGARFAAALQNLSSNPSPRETQRRRESVGRVPHVRDAPGLLVQTPASRVESCFPRSCERRHEPLVLWCGKHAVDSGCGGQRTARPTRDRVLTKFRRRRGSRPSNLWKRLFGGFNEAKPPMRFTLRVKFNLDWFGRAEHCAPYHCFH